MMRSTAILLALTVSASAQVALTPKYDVSRNACKPADCAAIKRSQDAPWVDRAVDFNGIGTAATIAMGKCGPYGCVKPGYH